jgi:hypothetical protein
MVRLRRAEAWLRGDVIGCGKLDPDPAGLEQRQQRRDAGEPCPDVRQAHVVDHQVERQRQQAFGDRRQPFRLDQHLQMPAEPGKPRGKPLDIGEGRLAGKLEIDPDAAHAGIGQRPQRAVVDLGADQDDAAERAAHLGQRIGGGAIVRAVDVGMDQHRTGNADAIQHGAIARQSGAVGRRVGAQVGVGIDTRGREHMRMAVAGAGRQRGTGTARARPRRADAMGHPVRSGASTCATVASGIAAAL